ncbi:hypothetical protein KIN20_002418 [Parelaphostrongylus tenuis]|uniref:Rootletin-like coiled-coil domain-containing protein n=1 Tax=Parelaphostrongylus tenuis TaxID=148309 RepID=A0AAD5QGR2_PARTN|nr:hypothetical protein KIN20_002418 [Parelaphostrongylus tenuis]
MSIRQGSSEDVEKVTEDLYHCRSRLEAGVEENKKNRDLIQELTDKVQRFRQRTAHESAHLMSSIPLALSLPQLSRYIASSPYIDYIQPPHHLSQFHLNRSLIADTSRIRSLNQIDQTASSAAQTSSLGFRHDTSSLFRSSSRPLHYSDEHLSLEEQRNIDDLISRLKSELFKNNTLEEVNELLREENDAALEANDNLRQDVIELRRALEQLEQGVRHDRERLSAENVRYRNQVEHQHRQLIELWKSFLAVKRCFRELHISTANDLDKQLTEFTRCTVLVKKAIRHSEFKKNALLEKITKENDHMLGEVMARYEMLSTSQIETEKQLNEKTRQLRKLQEECEQTRDDHEDLKSALVRICNMTELNYPPFRPRARSESPSFPRAANDIMRKIRSVLSMKTAEIREANARAEQAETEIKRLKRQVDVQEKEKKTQKDHERRRDQETSERELKLSTVEHDLRRATERLLAMEEDKNLKDSLLTAMQNTLASTQRTHKEFIETLISNHRDELGARDKLYEKEIAERLQEERDRLSRMQTEVDREKMEVGSLRQQLRDLKAEYSAAKKVAEEKDLAISNLEERLSRLKTQMDAESAMSIAKSKEVTEHSLRCDELMAREQQLEQELNDVLASNKVLNDEKETLQKQITQLRTQIDLLSEKAGTINQQEEEWKTRLEESQRLNFAHEQNMQSLKESIRLLEEKLYSETEKVKVMREQLDHQRSLTQEKTSENNERIRQIEGMKIERDGLLEDIFTLRRELTSVNTKMVQAKSYAEKRIARGEQKIYIEQEEKLTILEDFRQNFDRLTNKVKQKEVLIEDLKEQIVMLKSLSAEKDDSLKLERVRYEESLRLKEKELDDQWHEKLRNSKDELSKCEKLLKDYELRFEQLTRNYDRLVEEERSAKTQNNELKEKLQDLISKHKKEVDELVEQNNMDREDMEKEMQERERTKNAVLSDLKADLAKSEAEARETLSRVDYLSTNLDDAKLEIKNLQLQIEEEIKKREKQDHDHKERVESQEQARLMLTTELKESQAKMTQTAAQLEEARRKNRVLESHLEKVEANLARKTSSMKELEEKVNEMAEKIRENDACEQKYKDQIAVLEKENFNLNIAKDKVTSGLIEEQKKTYDLEKNLREANKTIQSAELKARSEKQSKGNGKIQALTSKIRQLEVQLADQTSKGDMNAMMARKLETERQSFAEELNKQKHMNTELAHQNEELRAVCKNIGEELAATKSTLEKKVENSKQAMTELLNNYKDSEKRSMERETECEQLKGYIEAMKSKVESLEKHRTSLETQVNESEARNADLAKKLQQYETSARIALGIAGSQPAVRGGQSLTDIPKASSSDIRDSHSMVRTTLSSHDLSFVAPSEKAVHFHDDDIDKGLDISSSMEITLRYLKERIEQLERDKVELTNDLVSQREEMQENTAKMKEASGTIQSLERRIKVLQNENENFESRLATQRQLYVSNEETMRAKDLEHRGLKAKIMSAELHIREKDNIIGRLTSEVEAMRQEMSKVAAEKQRLSTIAKSVEEEAKAFEEDARTFQKEREILASQLAEAKAELKTSRDRLFEYESDLQQMKGLLEDARKLQQKDREHFQKLLSEEKHRLQMVDVTKKSSESGHRLVLEEKISQLQHNYDILLSRNNALLAETDRLREELRISSHRFDQLTLKLSESEKSLNSVNQSNKNLVQQVSTLQKSEDEWGRLEREMREELAILRKDRLILTSEVEELKRKLVRAEVERKEVDSSRSRLDREVNSLKKHVEALEEDKSRTEAAIRNTMSERRAIDKSLAAMEKENTELYRNCAQLQSQIAQLERDSDPNAMTKVLKDQRELEGRMAKLMMEKQQLEAIVDQKEANFSQERRTMTSQMETLRDQLEMEKKRRLQLQKEARATERTITPERQYSRSSDVRMTRSTKSIQRRSNPFRMHDDRTVSRQLYERTYHYQSSISSISSGSYLNDTCTSVETAIY